MIHRYDKLTSTMVRARELAEEGAPQGDWTVARAQTAGRGRRGRTWVSGRDCGLYATLIWRPAPAQFEEGLTLAIGVAVAEALDEHLGTPNATQIKWPNDLWLKQKKVGGILVEAVRPAAKDGYLLIGVGINLSAQDKTQLQGEPSFVPATSLDEHGAPDPVFSQEPKIDSPLSSLVERLLVRLEPMLARAHAQFSAQGLSPFLSRFAQRDALFGRLLESDQDGTALTGTGRGIDATGRLLLAAGGRTLKLHAGEVGRVRNARSRT